MAAVKHGAVSGKYRSGHFTGTVKGVVPGGTKSDPMEAIRPGLGSRHPGEPAIIHRRASNLRSR